MKKVFYVVLSLTLILSFTNNSFANIELKKDKIYNSENYELKARLEEKFFKDDVFEFYKNLKLEIYIVDLINKIEPNFKAIKKEYVKNVRWLENNVEKMLEIKKSEKAGFFVYFPAVFEYVEKFGSKNIENKKIRQNFEREIKENIQKYTRDDEESYFYTEENELYIADLINKIEPNFKATKKDYVRNVKWLQKKYNDLISLEKDESLKEKGVYINFIDIHEYLDSFLEQVEQTDNLDLVKKAEYESGLDDERLIKYDFKNYFILFILIILVIGLIGLFKYKQIKRSNK